MLGGDPSPTSHLPRAGLQPVLAPIGNSRVGILVLSSPGTQLLGCVSLASALLLLIIRLKRAKNHFSSKENGNLFPGKNLNRENKNDNFRVRRVLWNFRESPNPIPDEALATAGSMTTVRAHTRANPHTPPSSFSNAAMPI